jgi:alkylhydroperoxidase family enzyme
LQLRGDSDEQTAALRRRDIDNTAFTNAERELLRFVKLVTETAYRVTADSTQSLRDAGWTDPQIAEAVYITALFAFFNRVADAFGLEDPGYEPPTIESGGK